MVMFRGVQLRGEFLRQVPQTAGLHMMMMVVVMSVLLERVTVVVLLLL